VFDAIKSAVEVLEGAYSFVLISILDPDAMYIVKNTGTMVIGFPEQLRKKGESKGPGSIASLSESETNPEEHLFQIVSSDTTVF